MLFTVNRGLSCVVMLLSTGEELCYHVVIKRCLSCVVMLLSIGAFVCIHEPELCDLVIQF